MNAKLAKIAWVNLFRNKRRNLLSLMAVVLGYLGMSLFFDYVLWAESWMSTISIYLNHNGHVTVFKDGALDRFYSKPRRYLISAENQERVAALAKADPRVEFVGRYLKGMGLVNRGTASTAFMAQGVDLSIEKAVLEHEQVRRWSGEFVKMQYQGSLWGDPSVANPVALTGEISKLLGYRFGQPGNTDLQLISTTFDGGISAQDANVVSRFSTGLALSEDSGLLTSLQTLQRLYDTDGVSSMAIYLRDRGELRSFTRDFRAKIQAEKIPVEVLPFRDEKVSPFYVGVTQFVYAAAGFFLLLVSSVVVISLANTMSMAVIERTREIGTLRSIGYLPSQVGRIFLMEGALLVAIGLTGGLTLNHVVAYLVNNHTNFRFAPPGIAGDAQFLVITNSGVSAALAVIFLAIGMAAIGAVVKKRTSMPVAVLFQGR